MASILFFAERFPPDIGGVARSAGRIAQALSALGHQVTVLTWSRYLEPGELSPPEQLPPELLPSAPLTTGKITVYRLGLYRHWDMTMPQTLNVLDWFCESPNQPPDMVWGHYLFPAGFLAVYFAQLKGLPSVVSARGNDIDRVMFPPGDFARLHWTLENASQITAVSQDMVRKVEVLSQRQAKLHRNVVDAQLFKPELDGEQRSQLKSTLGIAANEVILGFSGELREKKGQKFLLQALATVHSRRPACLLIIGELRPESQALLQSFRNDNPEAGARIIVTGHIDTSEAVAQHLNLCDLYLQPSLWDGLPNALLEAMACGCICIGSDAGGIPEVIESGQQGFLLPRSQLHNLGEAVLEVLALPDAEQKKVREGARSHLQQHYALEQEHQFLQDLLSQLPGLA